MFTAPGTITALLALWIAAPAAAQTAPTACSIIDQAELRRITGRKEIGGIGAVASDPSEVPKSVTECDYLGFGFQLTTPIAAATFAATRDSQIKRGTKVQPISGLGDDAYYWWDPKPGNDRQVGVAFRSGTRRVIITEMTSADSIEAMKPLLLRVAKLVAPRVQ